jgi:hypothetical protein
MSDPKSKASKTSEGKDRIPLGTRRLVGYGYVVVFLFFMMFFLFLAEARKVNPGLDTPRWSLLLAGILVLPLFLPALRYVAPYIKSIKVSDVEVSFIQAEVTSYSLATLTAQLKAPTDQVNAPEFAQMMAVSYSRFIVETLQEVKRTRDEVLVVDLGKGTAWIPPNLYFLALLAADKTSVRQIAFVETRHNAGAFVGMCFPDDLRKALAQKFPVLQEAAEKSNYQQLPLDYSLGAEYFQALQNLYGATPAPTSPRESWLTSSSLFALVGPFIQRHRIESRETLTESDYRQILDSDYPYTAVVEDEELESLISRDKVALLVARKLVAKSSV